VKRESNMHKGMWYWAIFIVVTVLTFWFHNYKQEPWPTALRKALILALLFLLGWSEFGFIIR